VIRAWRRLAAAALDRRFAPLNGRLDGLEAAVDALAARIERQGATLDALAPVLRTLAADDPGHRRRLHALRAEPGYPAAWEEADPLVTVSIPTRSRPRLLVERALASVLAQTYEHLEVLVIGDAAGQEVAAAVGGVGDPRVRFANLTHRFVREDGEHWLTAATLTRNEAYRLARGRWLLDFDDDDALRPGAIADLLSHARAERLEVVYGVLEEHHPGGATRRLGGFPPVRGQFGWQGALVHAGLRFFEREHVAADLGWSGDWFRLQRMLRAGVRIGHLEQVTCDYYPSFLWGGGD
jgi:glycosyltransferase involved in cell wall biosynthesis